MYSQKDDWELSSRIIDGSEGDKTSSISVNDFFIYAGDSAGAMDHLTEGISKLRSKGFLLSNVDSVLVDEGNRTIEAWIYLGNQFQWVNVNFRSPTNTNPPRKLLPQAWIGKKVAPWEVESAMRKITRSYEDDGYPFASLTWRNIELKGSGFSGTLLLEPGPFVVYDSLYIRGSNVKGAFLASYLGVNPGSPFKQSLVERIPEMIEDLPYVELKKYPDLTFQNEEARITISVEEVKANRLDAIIGFFPNESGGERLLLTGSADLLLTNLFHSGKELSFHWDQVQKGTQTLQLKYSHPNLLYSPIGIKSEFYLYKQDTTFINRKMLLGFDYRTGTYSRISFHTQWESSRLINTTRYINATQLPDFTDYNTTYIGIGFSNLQLAGLNYSSPQKWGLSFQSSNGKRRIRKIPDLMESLYDSVQLRSLQFKGTASLEGIYTFPIKPFAIYGRLYGGKISNNRLYLNDLFRLGGLKTIRGFNEYTFYASEFLIGTIEFQSYFNDSQSRIFAFWDHSYLSYNLESRSFSDTPFGVGMGIVVETGSGLLTFVYALGDTAEQPLNLRFSKIHFGYKATF